MPPEAEIFFTFKMPYTVPEFPHELDSVDAYKKMVNNAFIILLDRQKRMEKLLEMDFLPTRVEEDVRLARGKLMIMAKNKLTTFQDLTKTVIDNEQGVDDLTGFWSTCLTEMEDLKRLCNLVEDYHNNNWQPLEEPEQIKLKEVVIKSVSPLDRSSSQKSKLPRTPAFKLPRRRSQGTPGLRDFLANKRAEKSIVQPSVIDNESNQDFLVNILV